MTVDLLNEKRIKLVVNGGCLNPKGLAEKTNELVSSDTQYMNSMDLRCAGQVEGSQFDGGIRSRRRLFRSSV
jgi:hypothetical protein